MEWPFKWNLSTCAYTRCYLFFKISQNEIWDFFVEFYLWPHLAVKGLKTKQCDVLIPTSTAISAPSSSSWSLLAFRSSLSCYKNERFNMNKRIFVSKKFSHCSITQLLKSNVIIVIVITSGEILDKPRPTWVWYWSRCFFSRTAKLKR